MSTHLMATFFNLNCAGMLKAYATQLKITALFGNKNTICEKQIHSKRSNINVLLNLLFLHLLISRKSCN